MVLLWVKKGRRFGGLSHYAFFGLNGNSLTKDLLRAYKCLFIHLFSPFFVNLLLWVRVYFDRGSLTIVGFIDWLGLLCWGVCFLLLS